jgi:predicted kinase
MTKGLPASGKSTWAKSLIDSEPGKWKRINKDDMRAMFDNSKYSRGNENFVLEIRNVLIEKAMAAGYNVIVDDTNFHPKHEKALREIANKYPKVEFEIKDFSDVSLEECLKRDAKRENSVGKNVIMKMWAENIKPPIKNHIRSESDGKRSAIMCDLDGTLAIIGNRSPYDASKCDKDLVCFPVIRTLKALMKLGYKVIFVSGREQKDEAPTRTFLNHSCELDNDFELFMRTTGDMRADEIIKKEIYDNNISDIYNVMCVFDDRPKVVRMWRGIGLYVFDVGQDGVEF